MQTKLTESGPFERLLTVSIDESELESAKEKAARRLSKEMRVKGFRPGKVPRRIVEQMVGSDRLRSEALEEALPDIVGSALDEAEIRPAVVPSVSDTRDTESGLEVDVTVTVWPTASELPHYRARRVVIDRPELTDDELDQRIDQVRDQFAELERADRPAGPGDFALLDLTATQDGERVEEASATDLLYEVGSDTFIPGLDEAVTGASAGDIQQFDGTLPGGFGDRSGEDVRFNVLVKEVRIKRLPELTDQWVDEATEFETVAELRSELARVGAEMKQREAGSSLRQRLLDELLAELELEVPQALVDAESQAIAHDFVHRLEQQGIDIGTYLSVTGQTEDQVFDGMVGQAERNLRTRVLLEAIAEAEGVEVDADDVDGVISALANSAERPVEEFRARLVESGQIQALVGDMLRQKTIDLLADLAEPVDADGDPVVLGSPVGVEENTAEEDQDVADEEGEE